MNAAYTDLDRTRIIHALVRRHWSWRGVGRDALDLEDFEQEITLCVLEAERSYQPDRGMKLSTWLYQRTPQLLIDRFRRTRRMARAHQPRTHEAGIALAEYLDAPAYQIADATAEDDFTAVEQRIDAQAAVALLADRAAVDLDMRIVALTHIAHLTQRQIAERMAVSESRVSQRYRRGLAHLRALLAA